MPLLLVRSAHYALLALVVLAGLGVGRIAPATAAPKRYVAPGATLRYSVARAQLPASALGPLSLRSLERARGVSAQHAVGVLGATSGAPSPAWPRDLSSSASSGPAPLAATDTRGRCKACGTVVGDDRKERIALLYAAVGFEVGDEISSLRHLELRVRYRDGLIAYLNGREVARRNRPSDSAAMALARRPRGREWETFYIPVTPGLLTRGRNLISFEVRPSGRRLSPYLDLELLGRERASLVRGPMVQRVYGDRATIVFDSDTPARGVVEWGLTSALGRRAVASGGGLAVHHVVDLNQLPASRAIHYRVITGGDVSPTLIFHTAVRAEEPLRFAVYGDMRGGHAVHRKIVGSIQREAPDLVLVTGDLVVRGSDEGDWQRFFTVARDLLARVPYYPAAGNHDMGRAGDERRRLGEIFALPDGPAARPSWGHWYSFDVGGVHFAMIDSNSYEHADQLEWLKLDLSLARRRGVRAIFAMVHHGPYSRGPHKGNSVAQRDYAPVLAAAGVTMLFSGHDHLYQRGEISGLRYIVSGGGGAPLYRVTCGSKGKRRCRVRDGAKKTLRAYHYVMVTVGRKRATVCAKRPDGTPLEKCVRYRLPRQR